MATTYPATTFEEAVELTLMAANQQAQIVLGDANTEVTVEDGSTIPSIRKAQTDSMYFKEPELWVTGQTETDYLQLKKYINPTTNKESWWFAKSALVSNPIAMGTSPFGDDNWTLYTPEDLFISGKAEYESVYQVLKGKAAEAGYNLVRGSFEEGGTLTNTNDVLWYQTDGKYYNWFDGSARTVVAGSTPTSTGGVSSTSWVDRAGLTLRGQLSDDNSDIKIAKSYASNIALQSKTILDYDAYCDGVNNDATAITAMANDVGYVTLPNGKTTYIASDITLPHAMGKFGASVKAKLKIALGVNIFATQISPSSTQTVTLTYNVPYIISSVNLAGKYIEISNGLPDKIFGAETATAGSINPIEISKDDSNIGTYKAAMFKCTAYDASTQRAYLHVNPDFSASSVTANIYDDVNHLVWENIEFDDANTSTQPVDATIRMRRNFGGGFVGCSGKLNYVDIAYYCNCNIVDRCYLNIGATFSFSWNCCDNSVVNSYMVNPKLVNDSVLIFFKNCRRNKANFNTINGFSDSGEHWSILFHTNSDYNEAIGNNVCSRNGIGDYAFNKGNLITDNDIDCNKIVILGAITSEYNENRIRCRAGAEVTVGQTANLKNNVFRYVGAAGGCCVNLYDAAVKPFGFAGFSVTPQNRINLDGSEFKYSEDRVAIDYRTKVDFTTGGSATYLPSTTSGILGNGVAGICGYVQGERRISTKNCVYKNIHVGQLLVCTVANSDVFVETGNETFDDVSAAYIVKATDFNYPKRCHESYGAHFRNVDIVHLTSNWPTYQSEADYAGVNSAMVIASYVNLVYTHIIDQSCRASGDNGVLKWYDYLTSKPSVPAYSGQLTTTAAHQFSYRIPKGAQYYQPAQELGVAHTEMYINHSTSSALKTIKRTISEVSYS